MFPGSPDDKELALEACHQRSADRLVELCFKNRGVYIKIGQHVAQLVGVSHAAPCGQYFRRSNTAEVPSHTYLARTVALMPAETCCTTVDPGHAETLAQQPHNPLEFNLSHA